MKVMHLIGGGDTGGARTHVLTLLSELNKTDDVLLCCLNGGTMAEEAERRGIPARTVQGGFRAELRETERLLRETGAELLHCHGSRANLVGALLKGRLTIPVISTLHSDHRLDYLGRPMAALSYGTLNSLSLRRMDALVCVSDAMRLTYRHRGFAPGRLYSLYNAPPAAAVRPAGTRKELLARLGAEAPEDAVIVGCAARLDPVKELPVLLRGFASAAGKDARLRLLIAGEGGEKARLQTLCEELGISSRVFFPGWVKDMPVFYSCLDVNVLTSRSETFPYALTEGALFGVPAVAAAVGGIPALIEDGVTGRLFPPGDTEALAEALLQAAADPVRRAEWGRALKERTEKEFSPAAMAERQRAVYREILRPRPGIVISGACGLGNPGDEAMLTAVLRQIRRVRPAAPVTVLSADPADTEKRFPDVSALGRLSLPAIRKTLKQSGLFLEGGGNLRQDFTSRRSLRWYSSVLKTAKRADCRTLLFGIGLGPLSKRGERPAADNMEKYADTIVFRDRESEALARKLGVRSPEILTGADPALALGAPTERERSDARKKYFPEDAKKIFLLCLRPWPGTEKTGRALVEAGAKLAEERGAELMLLPLNSRTDPEPCRQMAGGHRVLPPPASPEELAAVLSCADIVVSERLHALVLAALSGVSCAGCAPDRRVAGFSEENGLPCREARDLTEPEAEELWRSARRAETEKTSERLKNGFEILRREIS